VPLCHTAQGRDHAKYSPDFWWGIFYLRTLQLCLMVMRFWNALVASIAVSVALPAAPPRLLVVLVFDQMRGDYLWRWEPFWSEGFRQLLHEGFAYRQCFFEHAATVTCAGHATIATGAAPERHGISGNSLVATCCQRLLTGCAEDTAGRPSPFWLQLPTLGDALRARFPTARVIALSHKARAAIMLGGHSPTGVFWLDPDHDGLVSMPGLPTPDWLAEWNRQHSPWRYAGMLWEALLPAALAPPDSVPWEAPFPEGTTAFPHRIPSQGAHFWDGFLLSPFSVEWLLEAAQSMLLHEQLGADSIPDLLWISISTTDFAGHFFGPDSREVLELYLACDRLLGRFLHFLDSALGRANYALVLTSDHGVAPIPEMLARRGPGAYPGIDAGRISLDELVSFLNQKLRAAFGPRAGAFWILPDPPLLLLQRELIRAAGVSPEAVRDSLVHWLSQYEGIGIVVPSEALSTGHSRVLLPDTLSQLLRRSFPAGRAGDILFYPKPFWIFGTEVPTTHGTPYEYDRSVPLLFFGGRFAAGSSAEPVSPESIAPTLAQLVGISLPSATGQVLTIPSR